MLEPPAGTVNVLIVAALGARTEILKGSICGVEHTCEAECVGAMDESWGFGRVGTSSVVIG